MGPRVLPDVLHICIYEWFSPGMKPRIASTGESTACHLRRPHWSSTIQTLSHTGSVLSALNSDGIPSAWLVELWCYW